MFVQQRAQHSTQPVAEMKSLAAFLASVLIIISAPVAAVEAQVGRIRLSVPAPFNGPKTASPANGMTIVAYNVDGTPGTPSAVLQITRLAGDSPPPETSEAEASRITSRYLLKMLGGIERARTNYSRSEPEPVRLGGLAAEKVSWSGSINGFPTNGVMYCVIVDADLVWFHAFGPGDKPDAPTDSAIAAIEGLKVMSADKSLERAHEK